MKFNTLGGKLVKGVKKNCRPFATYGLDLKINKICTVIGPLILESKKKFLESLDWLSQYFLVFDINKMYIFIHFLVLPPHGYD